MNSCVQYAKKHTFDSLCSACRTSLQKLPKMSYKNVIDLSYPVLGVALGIGGFLTLFLEYANHDVGFWSILSGVLAGVCFHLRWVKIQGTLNRWHTKVTLRNLQHVGFLSAVAAVTALLWYLFITCYYSIPMYPLSGNKDLASIWALFTSHWGMYLMYHSIKLEITIEEGFGPFITENNE